MGQTAIVQEESGWLPHTNLLRLRVTETAELSPAYLLAYLSQPAVQARIQDRSVRSLTTSLSASKHAAIGLMRATAAELAGTGVRANALCPTFVATPMTERSIANIAQKTGRDLEQSARALEQSSPLGRLLDPDEVAQAVVWLASPETAAINGQALVIDGGGIQA